MGKALPRHGFPLPKGDRWPSDVSPSDGFTRSPPWISQLFLQIPHHLFFLVRLEISPPASAKGTRCIPGQQGSLICSSRFSTLGCPNFCIRQHVIWLVQQRKSEEASFSRQFESHPCKHMQTVGEGSRWFAWHLFKLIKLPIKLEPNHHHQVHQQLPGAAEPAEFPHLLISKSSQLNLRGNKGMTLQLRWKGQEQSIQVFHWFLHNHHKNHNNHNNDDNRNYINPPKQERSSTAQPSLFKSCI